MSGRPLLSRRLSAPTVRKVTFGTEDAPAHKTAVVRSNTVSGRAKAKVNSGLTRNVMDELVECSVCLERLNTPKMLPCQHTFCLSCLESLVSGSELTCPNCRGVAQIPNGLAGLPSNLYLDSLLAAMSARGSGNEAQTKVANEKTQSPSRCVQCQTVGSVSMCQHCQQMLCPVCWPIHIAELKRQMSCLQDQLSGALERLNHKAQDFTDNCNKLHSHIDEAIELKIASVREQQASLNREAKEILTRGQKSSDELQSRLLSAESNVSFLSFDNITGDEKKVSLFLELHGMTSELLEEVSRWGEGRPMFDMDSLVIHHPEEEEEEEENAQDEYDDDSLMRRQMEQVSSPDDLSLYYRSRQAAPRLSLSRSGLQRPAGIVIAPWNPSLLYVAGTDNKQVLVVDRIRGRIVSRLTTPDMLCPQGVACSTQRLYVSDKWNHQIHVFSSDGVHLKSLGKKGNGDGQFRSPEGVAIGINPQAKQPSLEDEHMLLYVCDTGNDRLQIVRAHDGSVVRKIGIIGRAPGGKLATELSAPTGVSVNEHKIVVADCGNRRIKVYSLTGEKMLEFGSHGGGRGQFRSPECVAIDKFGFIVVGDSANARIQIFRPNGNLVRILGGRNVPECNLRWISGITVTENMEIITSDSKNHCVNIF